MESAILQQAKNGSDPDFWELWSIKNDHDCRCFGPPHYVPDKLIGSGSRADLYATARVLKYHIDIIKPL